METIKTTPSKKGKWSQFLKMLGPGILFAGSAIGVSHLVQATQAGAMYGYGLLWVVILIHIVKYPFFEFGPRYAAATGEDLIAGYKKLGRWVLILFAVITVLTMFIIQAVVTLVTASLAVNLFGVFENPVIWTGIILVISTVILTIGQYKLLDNLIKIIVITLTISTLLAVILAFTNDKITSPSLTFDLPIQGAGLAFVIALMGWMPAPLDLSVWHSIWANEKNKDTNGNFDLKHSLKDFKIGYYSTVIMAVFFLALGALIMFGSGEEFSPSGAGFAAQLIQMYIIALGGWAKWLIAIAAFTTMFSTALTCLDALPRTMSRATALLQNKTEEPKSYYWFWIILLIIGAMIILLFFMESMKQLVLVATILSFLTTPFFAVANYVLITGKNVPEEFRPTQTVRVWSWLGIVFLIGFSLLYLFTTFL
jgi:Mn2+/Fe2+ NRAMP family transporter